MRINGFLLSLAGSELLIKSNPLLPAQYYRVKIVPPWKPSQQYLWINSGRDFWKHTFLLFFFLPFAPACFMHNISGFSERQHIKTIQMNKWHNISKVKKNHIFDLWGTVFFPQFCKGINLKIVHMLNIYFVIMWWEKNGK